MRGTTWWIALLFAIGSACFVLGPLRVYAEAVGAHLTAPLDRVAPHHIGSWATSNQRIGTLYYSGS